MKMSRVFFTAVVIFGLIFVNAAYSSNGPGNHHDIRIVKLKIGTITELKFPDSIANVTKSISSESLQIETLGERMFLLAREMLNTYIYVLTQDNVSYSIHLLIDEEEASAHVQIKSPDTATGSKKDKDVLNTIELLKSLMNGSGLPGAVRSNEKGEEVFNDGRLRIVVDELYEFGGGAKAFVLTLENLTGQPMVIPIEHIELPGLLAISTDRQTLEAKSGSKDKKKKSTARAYIIVEGEGK